MNYESYRNMARMFEHKRVCFSFVCFYEGKLHWDSSI